MTRIVNIHWPMVFVFSLALYGLILLTLPFNHQASTVFLFALIAYWSRIPGVGIPSPMFILYQMDLVDLFSMIIAINIGGLEGALFALFGNIATRVAGTFPSWAGVLNDAVSQAVICVFIPIIHYFTNDIFVSMLIYTILRRLGFIVGHFVYPQFSSFLYYIIVVWPGSTIVSLTINGFYGKYFGDYFDGLMQAGISFNWILFIIATALIFSMWRLMVGRKTSKYLVKGSIIKALFSRTKRSRSKKGRLREYNSDELILSDIKKQLCR